MTAADSSPLHTPEHPVRFVTAAALFDGHDAAINIMRRILQSQGAEVVHLGHDRSVRDVVDAVLEEDAQGVAVSSYQGGHVEYFEFLGQQLAEAGASDGWEQRKNRCNVSSAVSVGPGGGSASTLNSRSRRETSERRASRNLRHATVTSQPFGSAGCRSGQVSAAWMSASCTASSAVAKSTPRCTRTPITAGVSSRSSSSSVT